MIRFDHEINTFLQFSPDSVEDELLDSYNQKKSGEDLIIRRIKMTERDKVVKRRKCAKTVSLNIFIIPCVGKGEGEKEKVCTRFTTYILPNQILLSSFG